MRVGRVGRDDRGDGWVLFAGTMLILVGVGNFIEGIAAVSGSQFFNGRAQYIFGDLGMWGWVLVVDGVVQIGTGVLVCLRNESVRWVGVALACINAVVQLLFIQAYALWALGFFTLDLLVIYALLVYGEHRYRAA